MNHKTRNYKYDNMRCLLIFLVIVGHCIELFGGDLARGIYKIIYSFHMPAFIYLTGKFARFEKEKLVKRFVIPYFIFQTIYLWFDAYIISGKTLKLQYTKPYWILWYLMVVILYTLLIPVLPHKRSNKAIVVIILSVISSLLAGYDTTVGYYLSLSRAVVLLPYFLLGYYSENIFLRYQKVIRCKYLLCMISLGLIVCGEYIILKTNMSKKILYGAFCYDSSDSTALSRIVLMVIAFSWITFLEIVLIKKKIPLITGIGMNTMQVFLLHGFIIKLAKANKIFKYSESINLLLTVCISAGIMIALYVITLGYRKIISGLKNEHLKGRDLIYTH